MPYINLTKAHAMIVSRIAFLFMATFWCHALLAQTTINNLGAAGSLTGSELLPCFQNANPAVRCSTRSTANLALGAGFVNVKSLGAVGDGQSYYDGYMANASSTLSTKIPISALTESGNTVTATVGYVPGSKGEPPPYYGNWGPGGTITIAGATPSGYNGPCAVTSITQPNVVVCTTANSGLSSGSGGTASGSAPFTSADAGKLICVQAVGTHLGSNADLQQCGTIAAYIDSQDVTTSFSSTNGSNQYGINYVYGTSDQTALATAFSAATLPQGGTIYFPAGLYIVTGEFDIPLVGSWTIQGAGGGMPGYPYDTGQNGAGRPTTALAWLTTSFSGTAGIYFGKGTASSGTGSFGGQNFATQSSGIRDIALFAGAGNAQDGGGAGSGMIGLYLKGIANWHAVNLGMMNFNGDCVHVDSVWNDLIIENSQMQFCAGWGINTVFGQGYAYISNSIEQNDLGGVKMSQSLLNAGGAAVIANTMADNGNVNIRLGPGLVAGNYFEIQPAFTMADSGGPAAATTYVGNVDHGATGHGSPAQIVFSVATTALPTCAGILAHLPPVLVSDATACINGTTYTGSGSTACMVQCNGTNWIETGAGGY